MIHYIKFKKIEKFFFDFFKNESKIDKLEFQLIHSSKNFYYIFQNVFILRFIERQHYEVQKNSNTFYNIEFYFCK